MLHASQQTGQVGGVGGSCLTISVRPCGINDGGLDLGRLDVDHIRISHAVAGSVGGVLLVDSIELIHVVLNLGGVLLASVSVILDRHIEGGDAVLVNSHLSGVQQLVASSGAVHIAVELHIAAQNTLAGGVVSNGGLQSHLQALELSKASGNIGACDGHRTLVVRAGDVQNGGGSLQLSLLGGIGEQEVGLAVHHITGAIRSGGLVAGEGLIIIDGLHDGLELIAAVIGGDQHSVAGGSIGIVSPLAGAVLTELPGDLVVLVDGQSGSRSLSAIQSVHGGQLQNVAAAGGHLAVSDLSALIAVVISGIHLQLIGIGSGHDLVGAIQLPADAGGQDLDSLGLLVDLICGQFSTNRRFAGGVAGRVGVVGISVDSENVLDIAQCVSQVILGQLVGHGSQTVADGGGADLLIVAGSIGNHIEGHGAGLDHFFEGLGGRRIGQISLHHLGGDGDGLLLILAEIGGLAGIRQHLTEGDGGDGGSLDGFVGLGAGQEVLGGAVLIGVGVVGTGLGGDHGVVGHTGSGRNHGVGIALRVLGQQHHGLVSLDHIPGHHIVSAHGQGHILALLLDGGQSQGVLVVSVDIASRGDGQRLDLSAGSILRPHDGGGANQDVLRIRGAGLIGGVVLIDCLEGVLLIGDGTVILGDCGFQNGGAVGLDVGLADQGSAIIEVHLAGGDLGGAARQGHGGGQGDLLALELGDSGANVIGVGDFQLGGGLLLFHFGSSLGDQISLVGVRLQSLGGARHSRSVIHSGLGEVAGGAGQRSDHSAEDVLGVLGQDLHGVSAGGGGVILPGAAGVAELPGHSVVLVNDQLGSITIGGRIQSVDGGQLQGVLLASGHAGLSATAFLDGQHVGLIRNRVGSAGIQLPADGGGQDGDRIGISGSVSFAIAGTLVGDELDSVAVGVDRAVLVSAGGDGQNSLAAADLGGADQLISAAIVGAVELHGAAGDGGGAGLDLSGQHHFLALILGGLIHSQGDSGRLGTPHRVQGGVGGEVGDFAGYGSSLRGVGVGRGSSIVSRGPAQELIAHAGGFHGADGTIGITSGSRIQIVLHLLLAGAADAAVVVVGDGDHLAGNAGHGDLLISGDVGQDEFVDITIHLNGSQSQTVSSDRQVGGVVASGDGDGELHAGLIGHVAAIGQASRVSHGQRPAGAAGGISHLGGDGGHLAVDGGVSGDAIREVELVGISKGSVVIPPVEGVALHAGGIGNRGLGAVLHLLGLIGGSLTANGVLEGHGVHRILGDGNGDHLVLLDIADGVGVGLGTVSVRCRSRIGQSSASIHFHCGGSHSVPGVHGDGEGEAAVIVHRGAAARGRHSSVAGAIGQGHGEGVDLPHSVQGNSSIGGIHVTGLIAGCRGSSAGAPAQEGVARPGGNSGGKGHRRTVGLRTGSGSTRTIILIICNGIGLGGQLGINGDVLGDRVVGCHRSAGAVLLGVPTVKGVTIHNGVIRQGADRASAGHLLGGVLGIVDHIGDGVAGDRIHHDLNGLGGGDVGHGVGLGSTSTGSSRLRRTVDVHALDLIAGRGRHGEGVAAAVLHAGGSARISDSSAVRHGELRGEVAHGHHDGVGQLAGASKDNIN